MNDSKLLETIRLFNQQETEDYLNSIFFNDRRLPEETRILFNYLCNENEDFSKIKIHSILYPKKLYSENRINKLMSSLQKNIEEFIVYRYSDIETVIKKNINLLKFYREKNQFDRCDAIISKTSNLLDTWKDKNKSYYYYKFLLDNEIVEIKYRYNNKKDDVHLLALIENIDVLYILTRFEFQVYYEMQAIVSGINATSSRTIIERIAPLLENKDSPYNQNALIKLYQSVLIIIQNVDEVKEESLRSFEELLFKHIEEFPKEEVTNLLILCINFYTRKYNQGNHNVLKHLFELNKNYISLIGGVLTPSMFQNMMNVALKLNHTEWAKQLIDNFGDRIIGGEQAMEIYNFNLFNYYFHTKEFDKIDRDVCFNANYPDIYYALAAKRLELKYYFDIKDEYLFEIRLEAFKIWLHRKKDSLPKLTFDLNNDFINMLRQIIGPLTLGNKERIEKIREKIEKNNQFAEKDWLLDKINELK